MFDRLFMQILDMSKTAGIVILIVIIGRLLLKKAPKVFSYALWAIVLFRLLCPVAIETQISFVPKMTPVSLGYTLSDEPISVLGAGEAAYQAVGDVLNGGMGIQHIRTTEKTETGMAKYVTSSWWDVWILFGKYVWAVGIAAMLLYSGISYLRIRKKLQIVVPLRDNIFIADDIKSPFVIGFIKPKIYLPCNLGEREQEYIILHEQHHIRRLDHIIKALAFLALTIHWFNPLVWAAFILASKDMEMSCDEAVIRSMGEDVRADYSASLLTLATGHRIIAGTPLAFGEGDTKGRIRNLAKWKKPALWGIVIAIILCIVLAVCLLTNPSEEDGSNTGVTYYSGTVVDSAMSVVYEGDREGRAYITLQCDDGEDRLFWMAENNVKPDHDLVGQYVIVRGKIEESTGLLVATHISITDKEIYESLNEAINRAILNHNYSSRYEGMLQVASFVQLSGGTEGVASPENSMKLVEKATVYGLAFHQVIRLEDGILVEEGGSHIPVVLTFAYDASQGFTLTEYWEPRDGNLYAKDIKAKFNGRPYPDTQKYIQQQMMNNYVQAMEYYQVGTDVLVNTLLDSIETKARFTLLENLIESGDADVQILLHYGKDTLEYCFGQFQKGNQNDLRGQVMAYVCSEILESMGENPMEDWSFQKSGQDWFDAFTHAVSNWQQYIPSETAAYNWGLTFTAENVTPSGLTIVCTQSGGVLTGELMTGSPYFVQRSENGEWVSLEVPEDLAWTMEGWGIPRNDTVEWNVNWKQLYGTLEPGKYRIGKSVMDFRAAGDYDQATIYAEFEIK